jgi:hypothetical protein
VRDIYGMTGVKSLERDYGFKDQIQRAAIQYLFQSKASCGEVRSQLYIALDLDYTTQENFMKLLNQTLLLAREISAFISYLKRSHIKGHKYSNLKPETCNLKLLFS